MRSSGPEGKEGQLEPDLRATHRDGVGDARGRHGLTNESKPDNVPTQEMITDGRNVGDSGDAPMLQGGPRDYATASTSVGLNDNDSPYHRRQIDGHKKEIEGLQLHDGPSGPPPRFPPEFDESLAKKLGKEQVATSNRVASESFEDRLRVSHHVETHSLPSRLLITFLQSKVIHSSERPARAAQEARGSKNVGNIAANKVGGPQLHDGPPGPPSFPPEFDDSLTKRAKNDMEGPQLHDGPPGPHFYPPEFDDSLTKQVQNDLERNMSENPRDSASTANSTVGTYLANAAAAVGPAMLEVAEGDSVSFGGISPLPKSTHTEAIAATAAAGHGSPAEGPSAFIVEAYRVDESEETPQMGTVYEAELAVLPFYQRKGFVSAMIAVTLLAIGVAVVAVVLPSKNLDGNAGGATTSSDDSLLPFPGQDGAAPQTSPPTKDPVTGQTASNLFLAPSSAPATFFDIPSISLSATLAPSLATNHRTPVPTTNVTSSNPMKTPTLSPTRNVSRRKKSRG